MMSQGTMTCRSKFITKKKVYLIAILNFLLTPRKISYIFIMDNFYASKMLWIISSAICMSLNLEASNLDFDIVKIFGYTYMRRESHFIFYKFYLVLYLP